MANITRRGLLQDCVARWTMWKHSCHTSGSLTFPTQKLWNQGLHQNIFVDCNSLYSASTSMSLILFCINPTLWSEAKKAKRIFIISTITTTQISTLLWNIQVVISYWIIAGEELSKADCMFNYLIMLQGLQLSDNSNAYISYTRLFT